MLARWILRHFPEHRVYGEWYGGGGSVLIRKSRAYGEIYNDLDGEVVTLFRVLRDPVGASRLQELLRLTPFAREEFEAAYKPSDCPIESSRRLLIRSFMGFGSDGHNAAVKTGFRSNAHRAGTTPAHDWRNYADVLPAFTERLAGVVIENRAALEAMRQHDKPETLHYVDPPYHPDTRSQKSRRGKLRYHAYKHEMTDDDHRELLEGLRGLTGMVVLSGYRCALYDDMLADWTRVDRAALADGARPRTESLWLNPPAIGRHTQPDFLAH